MNNKKIIRDNFFSIKKEIDIINNKKENIEIKKDNKNYFIEFSKFLIDSSYFNTKTSTIINVFKNEEQIKDFDLNNYNFQISKILFSFILKIENNQKNKIIIAQNSISKKIYILEEKNFKYFSNYMYQNQKPFIYFKLDLTNKEKNIELEEEENYFIDKSINIDNIDKYLINFEIVKNQKKEKIQHKEKEVIKNKNFKKIKISSFDSLKKNKNDIIREFDFKNIEQIKNPSDKHDTIEIILMDYFENVIITNKDIYYKNKKYSIDKIYFYYKSVEISKFLLEIETKTEDKYILDFCKIKFMIHDEKKEIYCFKEDLNIKNNLTFNNTRIKNI